MTSSNRIETSVTVMISGGFSLAYQEAIPEFKRVTGIALTTLSGASQGSGPKTIRYQLEQGAAIDVVILSNEGLHELVEAGRIVDGSAVELAMAPLAAAVRTGAPKPDIGSIETLARTLSAARLVVMPGSTSGLFVLSDILPKLGIAERVRTKVYPRGTESTAALASGEADIALGPISELVNIPGIALVGPLPDEVQLIQTFTAAVVVNAPNPGGARKLTDFLSSARTTQAIRNAGMVPVEARRSV